MKFLSSRNSTAANNKHYFRFSQLPVLVAGLMIIFITFQLLAPRERNMEHFQIDVDVNSFGALPESKSLTSVKKTIQFIRKPILNPAIIVTPREIDICTEDANADRGMHNWEQLGTVGALLLACPRPLNDKSYLDNEFFRKSFSRIQRWVGHRQQQEQQHRLVSNAESGTDLHSRKSSWLFLSPEQQDMVWLKIIKLLMTNRGCNEVLEPWSDLKLRNELLGIIEREYQSELTVLEWGPTQSSASDFLTRYFVSNNTISRPQSIRLNILSLQDSPMNMKASFEQSKTKTLSVEDGLQPSTIKICPDYGGDLRWIPDETFNFVIVSEVLQHLGFLPTPASNIEGQNEEMIQEDLMLETVLCSTLMELVRITKVGGTIWAGHIDDQRIATILMKCTLSPKTVMNSDFSESSLINTSHGRMRTQRQQTPPSQTAGRHHCSGYTVEMDGIGEHKWLGGKKLAIPRDILDKRPKTILWRKVPLGSKPAVTLAEY